MLRFVLLWHHFPEDDEARSAPENPNHWDLMLPLGEMLATWRLESLPESDGPSVVACRIADHRSIYLDYEGPISGGRGTVAREDSGEIELLTVTDRLIQVLMKGTRLAGHLQLEPVKPDDLRESLPNHPSAPDGYGYWRLALSTIEAMRKMGPRGAKT